MAEVNKKVRDSVFTKIFGQADKKYLLEAYKELHPEDTEATVDDLENVSLENVITNGIYNDLGFTVRGKKIFLVEAQSTWSINILIRMLLYIAKEYEKFIFENEKRKIQLYSNKKLEIAEPELYVIYTGNKKDIKDIISLKEEFFSKDNIFLELKAKVICYKPEQNGIIDQYIVFCRIYSEELLETEDKLEAIQNTIKKCISKDILKEYLSKNGREVEKSMMIFSSYEDEKKCYGEYMKDEGYEQGYESGYEFGCELGKTQGQEVAIIGLVKDGILEADIASQRLGISVEEINKKIKEMV